MRKTCAWLILITLLAAVLGGCGEPALSPEETAQTFLEAMQNWDYLAAYDLLSADSKATISSEDFQAMVENAQADADIAGMQVESVQPAILYSSGTRASVPYSAILTSTNGETTTVFNALTLVNQDDHWRVIWPPVR